MNHVNDDALLARVLELLEENELREQDRHLGECSMCSDRLIEIRDETEMLGSLAPGIESPEIPLPRSEKHHFVRLMKIAALLLLGFVAGYTASRPSRIPFVTIVPHHLSHTSTGQSLSGFTVCD